VVSFKLLPLYPLTKSPRYPLDRRLGWPQNRSGRLAEEKILGPVGTRTPNPWSSSPWPVVMLTTLSRLLKKKTGTSGIAFLEPYRYTNLLTLSSILPKIKSGLVCFSLSRRDLRCLRADCWCCLMLRDKKCQANGGN
jgi:hypothetical protein